MLGGISRREFMKGSALLAASAAVGGVDQITDAAVQAQAPSGPNERINIAIIGCDTATRYNGRGTDHINGLARTGTNAKITHICDVDTAAPARGISRVRELQGHDPEYVQDLRRIMDNRDIHAVTIATPNHWHTLAAIWAMQAGKHVYVEKPVSHNVSEGRRLTEVAHATGKVCQVGTQSRSSISAIRAVEFIKAGKLGTVRLARGLCYKSRPTTGRNTGEAPPSTVDYNLWCGPAPNRPPNRVRFHYDWHWQWDYGNGDIGNQGIHQMDVARWCLDKGELARAVVSVGGRFGYIDDGQTANTQVAWFDYGDKQLLFEVRGLPTTALRHTRVGNIIYGSQGYLTFGEEDTAARAIAFDLDGNIIERFTGGAYNDHYDNFLAAIRANKPQDAKGQPLDGHLSSALCHLANLSYRLGRQQSFEPRQNVFVSSPDAQNAMLAMEEHLQANNVSLAAAQLTVGRELKLDPQSERFVGDEEANRMLTREYRRGFEVPARA
jgi:predicted dehydrogenase